MERNIKIVIKQITPNDWQDYKSIRLDALRNEAQAYRTTYDEAARYTQEHWKRYTTTASILLAYDKQEPIGMMGAYYEKTVAVVIGVYVNQNYREKGIGKNLLKALEEIIKKENRVKTLKLWVERDQAAALALYKRMGFMIVGKESGMLGDGKQHEEYIMKKNINDKK